MLSEVMMTVQKKKRSDLCQNDYCDHDLCDHDLCELDLCEPLCLMELPVTPLDPPRPSLEGLLGPPRPSLLNPPIPFLYGLLGLSWRGKQTCSLVEREEAQKETDLRREQEVRSRLEVFCGCSDIIRVKYFFPRIKFSSQHVHCIVVI